MPLENDNHELIRYLLQEMAEGERSAFEDRYFADDELFERLLTVEDELLDDYASGELPTAERAKFERAILVAPGGRERLAFARALAARRSATRPPRQPVVHLRHGFSGALTSWLGTHRAISVIGVAAATFAIITGLWLLAFDRANDVAQPQRADAPAPGTPPLSTPEAPAIMPTPGADSKPLPDQPAPAPATEPSKPSPSQNIVAFAFAPQTGRGVEELRVLRIPVGASTVRLQLGLEPDEHVRYTAILKTADGREVLRRAGLPRQGGGKVERVTLAVPTRLLANQEYALTLTAPPDGDVIADYLFRVQRQ